MDLALPSICSLQDLKISLVEYQAIAAAQQELVILETTVQSLVMMVMRYKVMG